MKIPHALLGGAVCNLSGRESLPVVPIDLVPYMGTWRVLACAGLRAGEYIADASQIFKLVASNMIEITFQWREGNLNAPLQSTSVEAILLPHFTHAIWKLKRYPFFSSRHVVVDLAPDYSWAAVAHPSRKFGWVLSRKILLPDEIWRRLLDRFSALGYDPTLFAKIPHVPDRQNTSHPPTSIKAPYRP